MRTIRTLMLLIALTICYTLAIASTIDVSGYTKLTDNSDRYDRNPSIINYSGEYWLFYTKGDDGSTNGVRGPGYNPDNDSYVIWYKKATAIADLSSASETRLDLSETARPVGFDQRTTSAAILNGKLYVFASAGWGGSPQPIYYYIWDGTVWSGPTSLGTVGGGHINVVYDADRVYLVMETMNPEYQAISYTWDGTTLNGPYVIADGNGVPKITLMGGNLYVVSIAPSTTTINLHKCPAGSTPSAWTYVSDPVAVTDSYVWDPCIFNDGSALIALAAPSTASPDRQWIVQSISTDGGNSWTASKTISYGGYGTSYWWDCWPIGYYDGTDKYLFFTTEGNSPSYGDGEIAYIRMDWDFALNHYFHIQTTIDQCSEGDTVAVGPGIYGEQLKIASKNLNLFGAGIGSSIIEAVPLAARTTYSVTEWTGTTKTIDACIGVKDAAAVYISGFTIDGNELGPDNFYGIHYFNSSGMVTGCLIKNITNAAGLSDSRVVSLAASHGVGQSYTVNFSQNTVTNFQKGGILVMGPDGQCTVNYNIINGAANPVLAPNGIQVSYGATGTLNDNIVSGVAYGGGDWAGTGILLFESDDVTITGGDVTDCEVGIGHSQWNWIYTPSITPKIVVDGVNLDNAGWSVETHLGASGAKLDLTVKNCTIANAPYVGVELWGSDKDPWGGGTYGGWKNGTLTASIFDNRITGCQVGIEEFIELADGNTVNAVARRNDFTGNVQYGVYNNFTNMFDAMQNWWGDASGPSIAKGAIGREIRKLAPMPSLPGNEQSPSYVQITRMSNAEKGTGIAVSTNVDYSPWWGADYVGNVHALPWKLYLDNSNGSYFQEAVDAAANGDSIEVKIGTYDVPVNISGRSNLTLTGENRDLTIFMPSGTLSWDVGGYGSTRQASVRVVGSSNIALRNMTMDFNLIKGNSVFGLLYWNSSGEVSDNILKNVNLPDAPGGYYEFISCFRAPDYTDVNRAQIKVLNNTMLKTGRVAILAHDFVNLLIEGNTFDKVDKDFGYGIELGSVATGIIRNNVFRNYYTWAQSDNSSAAAIFIENSFTSGMGPIAKPVVVEGNDIAYCEHGVYAGNQVPGYAGNVDINLLIKKNNIHDDSTILPWPSSAILLTDEGKDAGSSLTAIIDSNTIKNNGEYGIYIYTDGNGDLSATLTENDISGHNMGVVVTDYSSPSGSSYNLAVHHNMLTNDVNAQCDVVTGFWDDGISIGNCWSDFESNSGFHDHYDIPGLAAAVDRYPNFYCRYECNCVTGEPNHNGVRNLLDVSYLINYMYRSGPPPLPYAICSGDADCNCTINLLDVSYLINYLYRHGTIPCSCQGWTSNCHWPLRLPEASGTAPSVPQTEIRLEENPAPAYK